VGCIRKLTAAKMGDNPNVYCQEKRSIKQDTPSMGCWVTMKRHKLKLLLSVILVLNGF
jgi:hypothetical protein